MKKLIVLIMVMALVLTAGVVAAQDTIELSLSYAGSSGSEEDVAAKKFEELVEKRSDGRIDVKLFGNEQLGKEVDVVNSLELGTVDMAIMGTTVHEQAAPKYNIWSAYYIFNDREEVKYVLNGPIFDEVNDAMLENKDIRILGYGLRGPRNLTANKKITKPEDVEGLDIRIPLQPIYVESWEALGANPQSIAYAEVYSALKQGVVDAQENPLAYIYAPKFHEVQDYCMLTKHQRSFFTYVMSDKTFQRLDSDLQDIIIKTGEDITEFHNSHQAEQQQKWRQKLEEEGMEFVEVDREAFKEELKDIPYEFEDEWVSGLYDRIQVEIENYHAEQD